MQVRQHQLTGLQAALVLIAFCIVAAVFSWVVIPMLYPHAPTATPLPSGLPGDKHVVMVWREYVDGEWWSKTLIPESNLTCYSSGYDGGVWCDHGIAERY